METLFAIFQNPLTWVIAVVGGFLLLLFFASLLELRYTEPYVRVRVAGEPDDVSNRVLPYYDNTPDPSSLPEYVRMMSDDAYRAGFLFDRLVSHAKAPKVNIVATVWYSPGRDTVLITGAGSVFGMPSFQTWMFTPLKDGRLLVTTDNNDEGDRSGLFRMKRVIRCPFPQVLAAHQSRLDACAAQTDTFTEATPLEALSAIYRRRVDRMAARGIARYTNPDGLCWRYTVRGAVLNCLGFFTQLFQTFSQAHRVQRKPIGSHVVAPLGQTVYARYARQAPLAFDDTIGRP
jgi:hypothetical protein